MTDVRRYNIDDPSCVECCEEGDYALFKDYEKLRVENAAQRARMAEDRAVYLKERKRAEAYDEMRALYLSVYRTCVRLEAELAALKAKASTPTWWVVYGGPGVPLAWAEESKAREFASFAPWTRKIAPLYEAPPTPAEYPVIGACVVREDGKVYSTYTYPHYTQSQHVDHARESAQRYGGTVYQLLRGEVVP